MTIQNLPIAYEPERFKDQSVNPWDLDYKSYFVESLETDSYNILPNDLPIVELVFHDDAVDMSWKEQKNRIKYTQ